MTLKPCTRLRLICISDVIRNAMSTFLLYWNPYFSSLKMERFLRDFSFPEGKDVLTMYDEWDRSPDSFNWSVHEHDKAQSGDRFVFVKVGREKPTGIVGVGSFTSDPYVDGDWSGQDRETYYMDMEWDTVINPTSDSILKTSELIGAIPDVDWSRGSSGVMVSPEVAEKIETAWHDHLLNLLRLE